MMANSQYKKYGEKYRCVFLKHNYAAENDSRLVELITTGDQKAFVELIHRYQRSVINFAFRFLGNREDAKDLAQETFPLIIIMQTNQILLLEKS
ncbi:MAG: hypothetical protein A2057_14745 [Ignavibacteria bacterium GWA2_35_9]|nr:MAG: hypothetical protein A2057_14745 [Ignavibacteria bacterium GWA2_35_9]OGU48062.1 MAG: hypothetical protein A2080_07665 [Ignavibacteria bacterium GWC2_36_12]OGU97813.1 MAG: hypothetical protein A3J84_01325 [Ignavibacteria bacterium RIFOXYA2_FULL_37_17]